MQIKLFFFALAVDKIWAYRRKKTRVRTVVKNGRVFVCYAMATIGLRRDDREIRAAHLRVRDGVEAG